MPHHAIGAIRVVAGATTQVTNGSADTYDLITGFDTAQGLDAYSLNMTIAKGSNKVTTLIAGIYKASFHCSFTGSVSTKFSMQLFSGGAATGITTGRGIGAGAGGDEGACSFANEPLTIAASVDVDMRVAANGTSKNFIPGHMALVLEKV